MLACGLGADCATSKGLAATGSLVSPETPTEGDVGTEVAGAIGARGTGAAAGDVRPVPSGTVGDPGGGPADGAVATGTGLAVDCTEAGGNSLRVVTTRSVVEPDEDGVLEGSGGGAAVFGGAAPSATFIAGIDVPAGCVGPSSTAMDTGRDAAAVGEAGLESPSKCGGATPCPDSGFAGGVLGFGGSCAGTAGPAATVTGSGMLCAGRTATAGALPPASTVGEAGVPITCNCGAAPATFTCSCSVLPGARFNCGSFAVTT